MLDNTIASIGKERFNTACDAFIEAKKVVNEKCTNIKFPCAEDGVRLKDEETACYKEDWGCGHNCIDEIYGL